MLLKQNIGHMIAFNAAWPARLCMFVSMFDYESQPGRLGEVSPCERSEN